MEAKTKLKVKSYKVTVSHEGEEIRATCDEFKVQKYPMVRVLLRTGGKKEPVYIFYKVGKGKLDWYKVSQPFIMENIAKALLAREAKS